MSLYRFGVEEEHFVTDLDTRNVRRSMSKKFFRACKDRLGDSVKSELLQSQIETLTPPCESLAEARGFLIQLPNHNRGRGGAIRTLNCGLGDASARQMARTKGHSHATL